MADEPNTQPSGLTRRSFLGRAAGAGVGILAGLTAPNLTTRLAFAAPGAPVGDVLVVVSLRGGFDGLSAIVPLGDPAYATARPTLAVPGSRALPTGDRFWGLHPALAPLQSWWADGSFGAVHAVGAADRSRSHFSATTQLEFAAAGTSIRTGWIDRALQTRATTTAFQGTAIGPGLVPQSMAGPFAELGIASVERFTLDGVWGDSADEKARDLARWSAALGDLHADVPALRLPARTALDAIATARALAAAPYAPANGARYPHLTAGGRFAGSALSSTLHDLAHLIRADVGLQVACVEFGDWDMHADLGDVDRGRFQRVLAEFAHSVAAFLTDLGPDGMSAVTMVTVSEFGRRVAENGDHGADHGHGNAMLLFGQGVVGGKVHGPWPGLASDRLDDGDLAGSTDYRDVLAEALVRRCGQPVADLDAVFPRRGSFASVDAFRMRS